MAHQYFTKQAKLRETLELTKRVSDARVVSWLESMVGDGGFEPPTSPLSAVCSNQLS